MSQPKIPVDAVIEIRQAQPDDRSAIESIADEVVAAGTVFVFEDASDVLEHWYQPGGHIYVATVGDETIGTYVIMPNQAGRGAHVANAGYMVRESAQGQGIGTAMGSHSLQVAKGLGYDAMQFNMVVATNTGAIHVWKKLGFEIVGRLPGAFRHPEEGFVDALIMYRRL